MLPSGFIVLAIGLRLLSGASYIAAIIKGRARPNLVSWFFWGFTALIAFALQIYQGVGASALITLTIGLGPVLVFALAIYRGMHKETFSAVDKVCAALTVVGIALWLLTKNPLVALCMSIMVDFVSGIPTIVKCYARPHTEHALPYGLSIASMVITLLTIHNWRPINWLFPAYILVTNLNFATLIVSKVGIRLRQRRQQPALALQEG